LLDESISGWSEVWLVVTVRQEQIPPLLLRNGNAGLAD